VSNKILFCGDSFAAASARGTAPHQWVPQQYPGYLDVVADTLNRDYLSFGYAGRDLWYASRKLFQYVDNNPRDYFDTVVLIIPNILRFPSTDDEVTKNIITNSNNIGKAIDMYFGYICDTTLHQWITEKILDEIKQRFYDKKIISFFAFTHEYKTIRNAPGMVCTTPLQAISFAEFNGNGNPNVSIKQGIKMDTNPYTGRANHFNEKNNKALANAIVSAINNYTEGPFDLDLSTFDIVDYNTFNHLIKNSEQLERKRP